jgi:hypothetical protein
MNLKIGQEIDGKMIHSISIDKDTRDITVSFDSCCKGNAILIRHNESIDKVLNHKWECGSET